MKQHGSHLEFEISHMLPGAPRRGAEHRRQPSDVPHGADPQRRSRCSRSTSSRTRLLRASARRARRDRDARAPDAAGLVLARQHDRDPDPAAPLHRAVAAVRPPHPAPARPAFVAGLLLGLVQAMHVDGLAFLVGLPAVFAITWLHTEPRRPRQLAARHRRGRAPASRSGVAARRASTSTRWDRYYLSVVGKNNVERLAAGRGSRDRAARSRSCCSCGAPQSFETFQRARAARRLRRRRARR